LGSGKTAVFSPEEWEKNTKSGGRKGKDGKEDRKEKVISSPVKS